jgi:amino acid transporter
MEHEKAIPAEEKVIGSHSASPDVHHGEDGEWHEDSFATRNGLNLASFQRRPKGGPLVVLDKSMKTRHLHMIAIGGSIGAGFFVGSGGALNTGVSGEKMYAAKSRAYIRRAPPRYSSTSRSWAL